MFRFRFDLLRLRMLLLPCCFDAAGDDGRATFTRR